MATSSKRDVKLAVAIETTGGEQVRQLADEVRRLGASGDPAAAEFKSLADQLDRLAQQNDAVAAVKTLGTDVERLAVAQREAAAATLQAREALEKQTATATELVAQQRSAAQAVDAGKVKTLEAGAAVKALAREYDAAGKQTVEYKTAAAAADQAVVAAKANVIALGGALKTANAAAAQAVNEESRLAAAYLRTRDAANAVDATVRERAAGLRAAEAAATAAGLATTDLAQADALLLDTEAKLVAQRNVLIAQQAERRALDEQNIAATERLRGQLAGIATAYEQEQAALVESAASTARAAAEKQKLADASEKAAAAARAEAAAAAALSAKRSEQAQADIDAQQAAAGLAEARRRGAVAAQSELAAIKDSEEFTRRYTAAQREAAAVIEREGVEAMRKLEQASREADKAQEQLAASLRETEQAAEQYAVALGRAAAAGEQDVAAANERRAAAERLIASERALTAEQREAATLRDRNRAGLIAEAQALLASARAADESRAATARLVAEARTLGTTLDGTGRSVSRLGELTSQAFGTTGVRSLQAIETEIVQVQAATSLLERKFRAGQISADDLSRALASATVRLSLLNAEARNIPALPGQFEKISASIQGTITKFGALGAAIATVGVAVRPVIDATVALDQMRRTLTTVTGSSVEAERQIDFLRKTAQQSGQSFTESGLAYAKFAASALQSGLSIKQTQDVFKSVSLAAGNLGLSSDQAKRALEALSQIASKGVVSMEELRQQLGDALPGVLPLLAKELGLTQSALNKVVESGDLLAQEAIPAIGRALQALQPQDGVVNGMVATWNRFINVVKEAGTTIVEGPLGKVAGTVITAFAGALRDVAVVAVSASEAFKLFGLSTLAVFDALTPGGAKLKDLGKTLDDFAQQAATNISKFRDTAYGASDGTEKLAEGTRKLGTSFAALSIEQRKNLDQTEAQVSSATKYTQAAKDQGAAITTLAELTGDEAEARAAAVEAANLMVVAAEREEAATAKLVVSLQAAKAQNEANAIAVGLNASAVKLKNDEIDKEIVKATASAEKSAQQAEAYRATAAAVALAGQAAADNSGKIDVLRKAYDEAKVAVEKARIAMVDGNGTMAEFDKATRDLAVAKGLLKDAINDVSAALERELKLMQADVKLAEAGVKLEIERQKNALRAAELAGDEYRVRQATLAIKEAELRLSGLSVNAKRAEAEATLRAIATEEQQLISTGAMTAEKQIELDTRRLVALAARTEAEASKESGKAKVAEYEALKTGTPIRAAHTGAVTSGTTATTGNTAATAGNTGALNANAGAATAAAGALAALANAQQRYQAVLKSQQQYGSGVTDGSGIAGITDPRYTGVRDAGGKDNQLAANGGTNFSVLGNGEISAPMGGVQLKAPGPGYEFVSDASFEGLQKAGSYQNYVPGVGYWKKKSGSSTGGGSNAFGGYSTAATRETAKARTVNVNLNIGGTKVPVSASSSAADQLVRALEAAQRNAGA